MLAYLSASHPPGFRWRDELLALFWPGLEHDGAGRALRKALFLLRQELGREAIVSRGRSQVGVAQELVWCDAVAFRGAVARGGSAEAAGLYRGEFLPGFHVAGLRDFDEWLDATRRELRALSTEAHLDLAERARREGNATETVRWSRRALECASPYDERAVRQLMRSLQACGRRAEALEAYDQLTDRLRRDLGISPAPETQELMTEVLKGC